MSYFKPFNPQMHRCYLPRDATGKLKRVTKDMTIIVIELYTRHKSRGLKIILKPMSKKFLLAVSVPLPLHMG